MNQHILFYSGKKNGCNFYRVDQPGRALSKEMACAVSRDMEFEESQVWIDKAQGIFSQMLENEKFLDWMEDEQKKGRKLIFDYDDDPFNVSPFNPAYEKRGIKEVEIRSESGELIGEWKHGVNGFDIEENFKRLKVFKKALNQADLVTTSTMVLKDLFSRYAYKVKHLRNMIDLTVWKRLNLMKTDEVRIVYQGGWSHYMDFIEARDALKEVMDAYKNVKLVIMGQCYPGHFGKEYHDRIEVHDWVDIELYPWVFKTLNADIGICPLEKTQFNSAKSEIKWVEYASLMIPSVVSDVRPYTVAVDHGKTGYIAKNKDEWIEYLSRLIESMELRIEIGREARKRIEDIYDVHKNIGIYKNALMSVFNRDIVLR